MNRNDLKQYISDYYGVLPDTPWAQYPTFEVFRHCGNRKWFAVIMNIDKSKLDLPQKGTIDVVNFKCDSLLIGSLRKEKGIFPAYHMSKNHWVTVALDGSANDETIKMLLDMSFEMTAPKKKVVK